MPVKTEMVDGPARLADICEEVSAGSRYAFDTEFHRERTYFPHLALVQIAWEDRVALVDPLAVDPAPLASLFDSQAVAVAHAVDQDLEVLQVAVGAVPRRVLDTQIEAGFLGMSSPSLGRLAEEMIGVSLPKADRLTDWTRRPLTADQMQYAAADVAHLLAIHDALSDRLRARGRLEWAEEECDTLLERHRSQASPEEAWWKMRDARQLRGRSRAVAQSVAAWRERTAAAADVPPRFILPDIALSSIAHRPPRSESDLLAVRGVERRHLGRGRTEQLLRAVAAGLAMDPGEVRVPPEASVDRTRRPAVALAAAWVAQLSDDLQLDAALLATRADLSDLLEGRPSRLDHGWRRRLAGQPVLDLAAGNAALAFDGRGGLLLEARSYRTVAKAAPSGDGAAPAPSTTAEEGATIPE